MTLSKAFTLGGDYFRTDIGDEVSTVIRLPVTPASQSVIDNATSSGNLNGDGSINYVNVFGNDQFEQLSAPNSWMSSLANDPSYQNTINNSISLTGSVATTAFDLAGEGTVLSSTNALNTDANNNSNAPSSGVLVYPISRPDTLDYLQVTTIKYVSGGLPSEGTFATTPVGKRMTERGTSIWLPMQPSITDNNAVSWNQDELNPFQARLANTAYNAIQDLGKGKVGAALQGVGNDLKDFAQDVASSSGLPNYVRAYFAGQAVGANIIGRQTGAVLNNNLELLFQGPTLRTFQYNYRFTPREPNESIAIKNIIKTLKTEMSVDKTGNGLFLVSPNVFELKYFFGRTKQEHPFLNKIKLCALTNLSVDYTPDGSYMTFDDGSMTSYNVSMQFSELEPIYKEDQLEASNVMGF